MSEGKLRQLRGRFSDGALVARWMGREPGAGAAAAVLFLCVAFCVGFQAIFIGADTQMSVDEGYMAGVAARMATRHFLPYVDAASQRGPMQYWLVTVAQSLSGGIFEWRGFRVLGIVTSAATVLICGALGRAMKRPFAGAVAGIVYTFALYFAFDSGAGIGVNGEHMANPFICGGVLCAITGRQRMAEGRSSRSARALFIIGGFLTGLAGFTKQSILVQVLPVVVWLSAVGALEWRTRGRPAFAPVLLYLGGWAGSVTAVLLPYALTGHLRTFFYWFLTYNADVHMGPYHSARFADSVMRWMMDVPYAAFPILLGMAAGLPRAVARVVALVRGAPPATELDVELVVAMQAALALLFAVMQLRFWPHHFTAFVPWLGLLFGVQFDAALRAAEAQRAAYAAAAVMFAVLLGGPLLSRFTMLAQQRARGGWEGSRRDPICADVQKYAGPREGIFVWGFAGDLYVTCRRRPASRYTYSIAVAGVVPPFWGDPRPERVARNAVRDVVHDLETERPPVIVDVPISGYSMTRVPQLDEVVQRDYCQVSRFPARGEQAVTIYARRDRGACP
jgi:hypothetical protein